VSQIREAAEGGHGLGHDGFIPVEHGAVKAHALPELLPKIGGEEHSLQVLECLARGQGRGVGGEAEDGFPANSVALISARGLCIAHLV
jgi:hypothetical protein